MALADAASTAPQYFESGAALSAILTFIGVPVWRWARKLQKYRDHQTKMVSAIHGAIFGEPEVRDNGVVVEAGSVGLRDRIGTVEDVLARIEVGDTPAMRAIQERFEIHVTKTETVFDQQAKQIREARRTAGEAAVEASAATSQLKMISERWWEWANDLQMQNQALIAALSEMGVKVADVPKPTEATA